MNGLMNGSSSFLLGVMRVLVTSAVIGVFALAWDLNRKVIILEEKITQVFDHSNRKDEVIENKLTHIEQQLDDFYKRTR